MREKGPTLAKVKDYIRLKYQNMEEKLVKETADITDRDIERDFNISKDVDKDLWARIQDRFYAIRKEALDKYAELIQSSETVTHDIAFRQMQELRYYPLFRIFRIGYKRPACLAELFDFYAKIRNDSKVRFDTQDSYLMNVLVPALRRDVAAGLMTKEEAFDLICKIRK